MNNSNVSVTNVSCPPGINSKSLQLGNVVVYSVPVFRPHNDNPVVVSVAVLALERTGHRCWPENKWPILPHEKLLPDIKEISDYFTFQQDSAPAHCAQETVDLLKRDTRLHTPSLWPYIIPVDCNVCGVLQQRVHSRKIQNIDESRMTSSCDSQRSQTVASLRGCERRTFRANVYASLSTFLVSKQLFPFLPRDTL